MSNNSASYILILIVLGMFFLAGTVSAGDVQIEGCIGISSLTDDHAGHVDLSSGPVVDNFTAVTSGCPVDNFTWTLTYPNLSTYVTRTGTTNYLRVEMADPGAYNMHVAADNDSNPASTDADLRVNATQPIRGTIQLVGNANVFNQTFLYVTDNYSATPDTFTWYFGDNLTNQTGISPTHKFKYTPYTLPGDNYTVMVTASNTSPYGTTTWATYNLSNVSQRGVQINPPPFANFTIQDPVSLDNITKGPRPLTVLLTGNVTTFNPAPTVLETKWYDDDTVNYPAKTVTFTTIGDKDLWLNATTMYGSNVTHHTLQVYDNITANFTSTPPSCPAFPVKIDFTDTSTGSIVNNRTWDFGDNSTIVTTNSDTISHVYYSPMIAKVNLTAHNLSFNIDNTTIHDVDVTGVYANFTVTPGWTQKIDRGSPATFNFDPSPSIGTLDNYIWNFTKEDGSTVMNITRNPSFSWYRNGTYNVSLMVISSSPCRVSNTSIKQVYVTENLTAGMDYTPKFGVFPLNVTVFDNSTDTPYIWSYDFYNLDGSFNSSSHDIYNSRASHWYMEPGRYHVGMHTSNGPDDRTKDFYITLSTGLAADFTANLTAGVPNLTVAFNDTSSPAGFATNWEWNFDDGHGNVTTQNATRTFSSSKMYNVTLTASNPSLGLVSSVRKQIDIGVPVQAAFQNSSTTGPIPLNVSFQDVSMGSGIDSWEWTFVEDAAKKSGKDVNYSYSTTGQKTVTLNVSSSRYNSSNSTTRTLYISEAHTPQSEFTFYPDGGMAKVDMIHFIDTSKGNPTEWFWDFGDGNTSTMQNPNYTYQSGGRNFIVNLTTKNQFGYGNTATHPIFINEKVSAKFKAEPPSGIAPLTVQFTDLSDGNPDMWAWDFGDKNTSTLKNPSHTFLSAGTYHVVLNVTNSLVTHLSDQTYMDLKVSNVTPAVVDFDIIGQYTGKKPLTVHFNDTTSVGFRPTSWYWDFGDGSNSFNQSPTHQFVNEGMYTVTLTVKNEAGVNDKTRVVYVVVMG